MNYLRKLKEQNAKEEGFTLIELMIVVVIIGILAAIAIPIFANQQKGAIIATVQGDVKNTVTGIATLMTKHPTATEAEVGTVEKVTSSDNFLIVSGDWQDYTVVGHNPAVEDSFIVYTSTTGKYVESATNPLAAPSGPTTITLSRTSSFNPDFASEGECAYTSYNPYIYFKDYFYGSCPATWEYTL